MKKSDNKLDIVLKEVFRIEKKVDRNFDALHGDFRQLQSAVDAYAKKADN